MRRLVRSNNAATALEATAFLFRRFPLVERDFEVEALAPLRLFDFVCFRAAMLANDIYDEVNSNRETSAKSAQSARRPAVCPLSPDIVR